MSGGLTRRRWNENVGRGLVNETPHAAVEAVWEIESTGRIAAITRVTHDIDIAEELTQDALVTALELSL